MKDIVVFASGSGTNAENIILHFKDTDFAKVGAIFCNNPNAGVIEKAKKWNVPVVVFSKAELNDGSVLEQLIPYAPDLIVLAGFLLKFPDDIVHQYPGKIINIHPALLPKYGGKGMYGSNVHKAVLENNEKETGISIHYVNEHYDEGGLIFQKNVAIDTCTTADEIAVKIHELEQEYFPQVIAQLLNSQTGTLKS